MQLIERIVCKVLSSPVKLVRLINAPGWDASWCPGMQQGTVGKNTFAKVESFQISLQKSVDNKNNMFFL